MILRGLVVVASVLIAFSVLAEEGPKRGVLPDGTPFRTDAEGNQIVDYIAELENAVDNLNRRIYGLEIDLKTKNQQLGTSSDQVLQVSGNGSMEERDLPVSDVNDPSFYGHARQAAVENQGSASALKKWDEHNRSGFEREMQERREQIEIEANALKQEREGFQREREAMRTSQYQMQEQSAKALSNQQRSDELLELLAKRDRELLSREVEMETLRVQNQKYISELDNFKSKMTIRDQEADRLSRELGAERSRMVQLQDQNNERVSSVARASLSDRRVHAMESAQGMMRTELNQLKSLVGKRDSLFSKYQKGRSSRVSISISDLRADNGRHLNALGTQIDDAQRMTDLSEVKRDIAQIRTEVRDDIAVIERMSRVQ